MKKLYTLAMSLMAVMSPVFASAATTDADKPLLTIGCLSDLHNELSLINSTNVDNIRLRGTVINTLNAMKDDEQLDMLILGGDYTSDCTIPEANWARVRDLIHDASKDAFPVGSTRFPVIYCTGNHDYEVANFDAIPKPYNAARYYDFVMKNDLGELDENECFFEDATNGNLGTMRLLAAYHYQIKGIDFVVLNCGKNYFQYAWNYVYSDESVQWVSNKLDELYANDPEKTVFFIAHVPFPDSHSISNSNKGQQNPALLRNALAKHPNVIFLYGHDHGSNNAYIRSKVSQRVTRYNTDGNIITAFDDTHVDGTTMGGDTTTEPETPQATEGSYYVINKGNGQYLGYNGYNSATIAAKNLSVITLQSSADGGFYFEIGLNQSGQKYLHIGTGGKFSLGDATNTYIYKVISNQGGTITAEKVKVFNTEDDYLLVGIKDGVYYALTSELYSYGSTSQRMLSVATTVSGNTLSVASNDNLLWNFGQEQTTTTPPAEGITSGDYCIHNLGDHGYLNFGNFNAETATDPVACNITSTNGVFNIKLGQTARYLYCGTNGRFSGNTAANAITLYEIDSKTGTAISAHKVTSFELGKQYLITGVKNSVTYALSSEMINASSDDQRLLSTQVTLNGDNATVSADNNLIWEFTDMPSADPSFFSAFMGSMRYYNNSIEGDVSVTNSRVVQGMMIYVYSDRIEFHIKNYGETGTLNGITIEKDPQPYTVFRRVVPEGSLGAIGTVATDKTNTVESVYDLQGRRVSKADRGIYIVNGEKVAY